MGADSAPRASEKGKSMTWSARIEHTPDGLALTFGAPLSRLDMSNDVAAHLASLLAVEARQQVLGVVRTLTAENGSTSALRRESQKQLYIGTTDAHPLCCDCETYLNGDHHE